jgi:flagellar biosynthesis protein FliQ
MTLSVFIDLLQQSIWIMMLLSAPVLIVSMVVGIGISVFQTVTSIQESTLTFVPKILAGLGVLLLVGPWMVQTMISQTKHFFELLIIYGH